VTRDSLFGDAVLWSGRPKVVTVPTVYRVAAGVCGIAAAISTASAIVVATALRSPPGGLLFFAAWMSTLGIAFGFGPRWWRSGLEFALTDRHIVVRRGRLRRSMDRKAISFARIHWHPTLPGIGDLELVRAVPTGALRRRLSIVLTGVIAPDRVWAIIRGVTPAGAAGVGHRLLAQRLDEGERVIWSAHPLGRWRRWVPGWRALASAGIGIALSVVAVLTSLHSVRGLRKVIGAGLDPESVSFVALVASVSMTVVLLAAGAVAIVYASVVRPARLEAQTRYLITDRRVLIQRGHEELHLDRSRIVDVIDAPAEGGLCDVFLVLDGPRARAFAPSGAFGEARERGLLPVLHKLADADSVARILRPQSQVTPPLEEAA
jgi:succinate dehydrogenase hydrophobic anchor subunit